MAIIQKIRTRAGLLLAIVIGMALFAFILGDFITSGGFIVQKSRMNVAEINGTKISYPDYQKLQAYNEEVVKIQAQTTQMSEEMVDYVREQSWQNLIQKYLLEKEYEKLGLVVSDPEFSEMINGPNPHPRVVRMFPNAETGTLNRLQLSEFLSRIDEITGPFKTIWVQNEQMINVERLYIKYNTLIRKGLYVNKLEAQQREKAMATSVDFSFIQQNYSAISDSSIVVSEAEMKKYYKENIEKFKQEETRDLKYVAFNIEPSKADFKEANTWINEAKSEFEEVEDVAQYINFNSPPYDPTNYKEDELPDSIGEFMFNAELGDVYGPYFENNTFKLAKLAKINYMSDSVKASHILLPADQSNVEQMRSLADSLMTLANDGYDFSKLVRENSRDYNTVITGGDLGWFHEGMKGPYFSDSCFYSNIGEVKMTYSEEGFHVVKVTAKARPVKKIQVGVLTREVTPGTETDQKYYKEAVEFASSNTTIEAFEKATANMFPAAYPVQDLKPLDKEIPGIEKSRTIVHWAFQSTKPGEMIKDIDDYSGKYIVAIITGVHEKGYAPFEDVSDQIKSNLIKEKKAALLSEEMEQKLANAQNIDELATELELPVKSANGIRFTSSYVSNVGAEPKLVGTALNAPEQKIVGPIAGENGVFFIYIDNKVVAENQGVNIDQTKSYIQNNYAARANRESFEIIKELGKIKDYRHNFY